MPSSTVGLRSCSCIGRLLDFKRQEDYFDCIVNRYKELQSNTRKANSLDSAFASLSLDGVSRSIFEKGSQVPANVQGVESSTQQSDKSQRKLPVLLMAMRKLREAIVSSGRCDAFAIRVYIFIIRTTVLLKHLESYHPALQHILQRMHPITPLTESERHEMIGYFLLDIACRQRDLANAFRIRRLFEFEDEKVIAVLRALSHGNWYLYWTLERIVDPHQKQLMEWGDERMRGHALKCLAQSFLSIEKKYVEEVTQRPWEELKQKYGVIWPLDEEIVTIRRIKRK